MFSHLKLVPVWCICTLYLLFQNVESLVKLTSNSDIQLGQKNATSFDCNVYTSCTTCVASVSPCDWCVDGHRCTHVTSENCRNNILVTGVSREGPSYRSGPSFCPAITETFDGSSEMLVHAGTKKSIRVKIHIIGQFIVQTRFLCQYNIEKRITSVNADLIGDTIYCDSMEFSYALRAPNVTASFGIAWGGGSNFLDNPLNIHVVIYKCNEMAISEAACSTLEKKYECGWCRGSNRCEFNNKCDNQTTLPNNPVDFSNARIIDVNPKQLQRTTVQLVKLTVDNLPESDAQFLCVFSIQEKDIFTNATRANSTISCATPSTDSLPFVPKDEHSFTAALSVTANNSLKFGKANLTFFDCNTYLSCTPCVSSSSPCDWCVDGHRCTHDTYENCHNDILVTGVSRQGPSYRSGPSFCPSISETFDGSSEILVHAGTKKSIRVKIHIIGQFIVQTRFLCQYNIEKRITSVNADLIGDTIYCESMEFSYALRASNVTASFGIAWGGGSKFLDNPLNIHVVIYKCNEMAVSEAACSTLEKKYECGWCSNRCEFNNRCSVKV